MKFILVFFSFMLSMAGSVLAQPIKSVEVTVTISNDLKKDFIAGGRLLLRISKQYEKVQGNRSEMNVGVTAKNWDATNAFVLDANGSGVLSIGLEKIGMPATEKYYYQVLYRQNVDGNDSVATYLYSNVDSFQFAKKVRLKATLHNVSREQAIINHPFVKAVTIKSKYLSDFFGKPKYLKASILLPSGYFDHPGKVYPICYRAPGLNGRYTAVNSLMNEGKFADWWFAKNAPQVIYVFLDSQGPYGDTYQVDSENNGPCSKALTEELIPAIEKEVKYQPETGMRYLAGRSTGGWIALGLQVFYPDFFDGAFSYSPDPVDFEHFGLIDIYHDSTIFYNQWGYLQPGRRTIYGQPTFSMQDWIAGENVFSHTNDYRVSGRQFGAYNAVFGTKGKDGLPSFMFDPYTGKINHAIAKQWEKYDLKKVLEKNWATLGPKLQGKLWIWMGDMDGLYSNVATRFLQKFLEKTEHPISDAKISFTAMAGHTQEWSDEAVITMVAEKAGLNNK